MPTDTKKISAAVMRGDATIPLGRINRQAVDGRQSQVACDTERPPPRQQEAISGPHPHRVGNAFHGEPALAGNDRVEFDAVMPAEPDRPVPTGIKATGRVTAQFQQ